MFFQESITGIMTDSDVIWGHKRKCTIFLFLANTKLNYSILMETFPHLWFRDGRIFVAGGKSNHLHLWCLESRQLIRIIQMPAKVRAVRHLEFLPDSFDGGSNQVSFLTKLKTGWADSTHIIWGRLGDTGYMGLYHTKGNYCAKCLLSCSISLMECNIWVRCSSLFHTDNINWWILLIYRSLEC